MNATPCSLGKRRRLQQTAGPKGTFTVLAIDHRGPLRRRLAEVPGIGDPDAELAALKRDIVEALASSSSAVLLDPEIGLGACVESGALPGSTGLLVALDTGSTGDPAVLRTGLVPGWSPARIAAAGASGVKLLVYYHPDTPEAAAVEGLVREVGAACAEAQVPLFLEPLGFRPGDMARPLDSAERRRVTVETARRLTPLGVDILKAEFPVRVEQEPDEAVWREACRELDRASAVPWVILSAGVSGATFHRQTVVACEEGASGVIAGRSIWAEAVTPDRAARRAFLAGPALDRLHQLRAVCEASARPWTDRRR